MMVLGVSLSGFVDLSEMRRRYGGENKRLLYVVFYFSSSTIYGRTEREKRG
jgi:hypothetical protein